MVDGYGIPLDRVLAAASRRDSPLLALRWTNSTRYKRGRQATYSDAPCHSEGL